VTLALRDLQAAFAAHLVDGDAARLAAIVTPSAARLGVHRHHVFHSLAAALGETFSTVKALVGPEFFRRMARAYVAAELPTQPVLGEYGRSFDVFVAGHAAARDLPYLADVARLDWALNRAFHCPFQPPLGAADLQAVDAGSLPQQRLVAQAGAALIESDFAIDRIWAVSRPGAAEEKVDPWSVGIRLLVLRRSDDAAFVVLSAGEARFVAVLIDGATLEEAAGQALAVDPAFDLSPAFARLVGLGVFAALRQA
jgi:hypothetical protein